MKIPDKKGRYTLWWVGLVLLTAFLLRYFEVQWISGHPFFETPVIDASEYHQWALDIVRGLGAGEGLKAFIWNEVPIHGPVYPYLLALLHLVSGGGMFTLRLLQGALLGFGLSAALYCLANRMFPRFRPTVGLLSAAVSATYIPFVRFDVELLATSTSSLLIALGVLALMPAAKTESTSHWSAIAGGLLIGLAALTRPNALLCLPFLAAWIVWTAWRSRIRKGSSPGDVPPRDDSDDDRKRADFAGALIRAVVPALLFCAAALAVILPVTLRNARLGSGSLLMIQANGGLNLYLGNNSESGGTPYVRQGAEWIRLLHAPRLESGAETPAEHDDFYLRKVRSFITTAPWSWMKLQFRKTYFLLHGREVRGGISTSFYPGDPLARFPLPRFGWIFPLALAGMALAFREKRLASPASVMLAAYGLTLLLTMVGERYRLPAAPLLIPYAAFAVIALVRLALGREGESSRRRFFRIWAPTLVVLFALVNIRLIDLRPPNPAEDNYLLSHVYYKNGDFRKALDAAEKAVELDESEALAWYQLGLCLERTGGGEKPSGDLVETAYRHAVDLAPDYVEAMENLGARLFRKGQLQDAESWYRRAAESRPFRAQPWHALGILAEYGDDGRRFTSGWDEVTAEDHFRQAARLDPQWAAPALDLGVVFSRCGRHAEAETQYRQALALDSTLDQARFYLALALEQMGLLQEAIGAMDAYILTQPSDPRGYFHAGRLAETAGERVRAIERYGKAVELNPHHEEAVRKLAGLRNDAK